MPETPDFRQMARDLTWTDDYGASPIGAIEEQLRQVWNARGAADLQSIDAAMTYSSSGTIEGSRRQLERAIQGVDR